MSPAKSKKQQKFMGAELARKRAGKNTNYFEWTVGETKKERVHMGLGRHGVSGLELLTDAGTGNLLVNCAALDGYFSTGAVS